MTTRPSAASTDPGETTTSSPEGSPITARGGCADTMVDTSLTGKAVGEGTPTGGAPAADAGPGELIAASAAEAAPSAGAAGIVPEAISSLEILKRGASTSAKRSSGPVAFAVSTFTGAKISPEEGIGSQASKASNNIRLVYRPMDLARTLALVAVAAAASLGAYWLARRVDDDLGDQLLAWARARGHLARGDGRSSPVEVVGAVGQRRFTVSLHPLDPPVMLVGLDCHADDGGDVHDSTLVTRWTRPRAADLGRLDEVLSGMAEVATELEKSRPATADTE